MAAKYRVTNISGHHGIPRRHLELGGRWLRPGYGVRNRRNTRHSIFMDEAALERFHLRELEEQGVVIIEALPFRRQALAPLSRQLRRKRKPTPVLQSEPTVDQIEITASLLQAPPPPHMADVVSITPRVGRRKVEILPTSRPLTVKDGIEIVRAESDRIEAVAGDIAERILDGLKPILEKPYEEAAVEAPGPVDEAPEPKRRGRKPKVVAIREGPTPEPDALKLSPRQVALREKIRQARGKSRG